MANGFSGFGDLASDLREFARDSRTAARRVDAAIDRGVERFTEVVFTRSQSLVPVKTGALKESGEINRLGPGKFEIRYTADHAIPVERGVAARTIEPVNADALRFVVNGEVVFARRVEQEARPGVFFLARAVDNHRDEFGDTLREELRREFRAVYGA